MSDITPAAIKRKGNVCGFPTLLDDVVVRTEMEGHIVTHFTGTGKTDGKRSYSIIGGLILSSNSALVGDEER